MIYLKHPSGFIKKIPEGFSFTTLIFGLLIPLFRGWVFYAIAIFISNIFTCEFTHFVFPFFINSHYAKYLLDKGYRPMTELDSKKLTDLGLNIHI